MAEPATKRFCEAANTVVKKIAVEGNIGECVCKLFALPCAPLK